MFKAAQSSEQFGYQCRKAERTSVSDDESVIRPRVHIMEKQQNIRDEEPRSQIIILYVRKWYLEFFVNNNTIQYFIVSGVFVITLILEYFSIIHQSSYLFSVQYSK